MTYQYTQYDNTQYYSIPTIGIPYYTNPSFELQPIYIKTTQLPEHDGYEEQINFMSQEEDIQPTDEIIPPRNHAPMNVIIILSLCCALLGMMDWGKSSPLSDKNIGAMYFASYGIYLFSSLGYAYFVKNDSNISPIIMMVTIMISMVWLAVVLVIVFIENSTMTFGYFVLGS